MITLAKYEIKVPDEWDGVDLTGLSEKRKAFCEEYTRDYNGARSAHAVGYHRRYAYHLLAQEDVSAYISYLQDSVRSDKIADRKELLERLTMAIRGDMVEEVVTVDGRLVEKGAYIKDQLKAQELLMKHYGMLKDVQDINQNTVIEVKFEDDFVFEEDEEDSPEEVV